MVTTMFWKRKPYSVKLIGRRAVLYRESDRAARIPSEPLYECEHDVAIYLSAVETWDSPHDGDALTAEDRARIQRHVERDFKARIQWH